MFSSTNKFLRKRQTARAEDVCYVKSGKILKEVHACVL